jgi:hypothetical protein
MQAMIESAITGFNQFLKEQAEAPGHARLTLVLFDNEFLPPPSSSSPPIRTPLPLRRRSGLPRRIRARFNTRQRESVPPPSAFPARCAPFASTPPPA